MMKKVAALMLLAAATAGCIDDGTGLDVTVQESGGGTHEGQGRLVLGKLLDGAPGTIAANLLSTSTSGTKALSPAITVAVVAGPQPGDWSCLQAMISNVDRRCADPMLIGYGFLGSNGSQYTITASATFTTSQDPDPLRLTTGYALQDAAGVPYCPQNHLAYPTAGEITRSGLRVPAASRLTWACSEYLPSGEKSSLVVGNGVRAKAISWGFPSGQNVGTVLGPVTGADMHTTAVRVGRADYCYAGVPNTIEGTAIGYLDMANGNLVPDGAGLLDVSPLDVGPVVPGAYYFEAAWRKPVVSVTLIDSARPLCLSKLRWSTLPPGDLCVGGPGGVPILDPRVDHPGGLNGFYCEDLVDYDTLAAQGAIIVNTSQFNDLGLNVWRSGGGDAFTTTTGSRLSQRAPNGLLHDEPPATSYDYDSFLGTVLTDVGRTIWMNAFGVDAGTIDLQQPLETCSKLVAPGAGERATSTPATRPANYGSCIVEGYLWTVPPAASLQSNLGVRAVRLYRYKKAGATGDYLTTTDPAAPGYPVGTRIQLGYILEPRHI